MTCNCNDNYGCGGACDPGASNTAIKQAVNDALAAEKVTLEGYVTEAALSATEAGDSAADAASSASAAAQSQANAETAANTATQAATSVTNTAIVLEETAERIEKAQDLLEEQIASVQTKPVYFEVSTPTSSLVLPATETVFNVRSIYIASARQSVGYGFTFDKETRTVTLAEGITAEQIAETEEGFILIEVICDVYNSDDPTSLGITLASDIGATLIGTSTGETVEVRLNTLASEVDPTLRQDLGSSNGLKFIGQVPTVDAARSLVFDQLGQQIFIQEHSTGMGQGGGIFYCHSLTNPDSLVDDNGFQIVTASGQVLRRKDRNIMSAEMFGAIGGQDITPVLNNMILASKTFNIQEAYVPHPLNKIAYTATGGSVADVTDGIGFNLIGIETVNKGPAINHISNNIFLRFRKDGPTTSSFYEQCSAKGLLIRGRNADNTAAGNDGYAIEASDIIGFHCDLFCTGYTNTAAAAVSLYNDTSFTEQSRIKLHVRNCCNGVHFHRNAAEGATSTNSFMGTELDLSFQAAVSGKANNAIVVGNLDGTTTSNTFDVNLYASKLKLKYWAEAGSATRAILVTAKGIVPESTTLELISDGYGFGTSDTDTTTTPATQLIRVENGGIFRAKCIDYSMQTGLSHKLNQLQRLRNSIFSFQDDTYKVPYTDARPYINPVGMSCICSGTIDVATQQAGASWTISGLPMGMRIRVTINQYLEGETTTSLQEVWEVLVRGDAQSVICTPLVTNDVLTTTTGLAVVNSAFATATFLKSVAAAFGKFWQGDSTRTRLTVRNNNDDNSLTTGSSDGRKFRIFLPVNASATSVLHYSVKLEVV